MNFFFSYVQLVHELCHNRITEDCTERVFDALGINSETVDGCIDSTFVNP
jgi:hypothetical protein